VGASNGDDTPLQHVKWLTDDGEILGPRWKREIGFVDRLRRSATSWRGLVDRANVVLGSIHKIELSGSVAYWQRHGFTERAKNNPGKAFLGAAHYSDMPFVKEKKSRFAVKSQRRKVDLLLPKKYFRNAKYCMRLFEV